MNQDIRTCLNYLICSEFESFQEHLALEGYEWEGYLDVNSETFKQAMADESVNHIYKSAYLGLDGE
jgi:hypothetical protein